MCLAWILDACVDCRSACAAVVLGVCFHHEVVKTLRAVVLGFGWVLSGSAAAVGSCPAWALRLLKDMQYPVNYLCLSRLKKPEDEHLQFDDLRNLVRHSDSGSCLVILP